MKTVVILGMGDSRVKCPYDKGYEIWGVNNVYRLKGVEYVNKLFLAHKQVYYPDGEPYFDWERMNNLNVDILNIHKVKGLKSRIYPYKRISKKYNTNYFSNCICYMLAYALDKGYERILIYGVDMIYGSEYTEEKGGVEYWIGRAQGMGVEVEICADSFLLKTIDLKPYGFEYKLKDIDPHGYYKVKDGKLVLKEIVES